MFAGYGPPEGDVGPHRGDVYSLLAANCQHFVRRAIGHLKQEGWTDPRRLQQRFSLAEFQKTLRLRLQKEAATEDRAYDGEEILRRAWAQGGLRGEDFLT